jgi:hypothetical protein
MSAMTIDLFLFTSRSLTNIWAGIGARTWAVSETSQANMRERTTKSKRLRIGSIGLLYCSEIQSFTTPFLVFSEPDPEQIVTDIWPERWRLPFRIHPLGNPTRVVHKDRAKVDWPILKNAANKNLTAVLNITGTTVFIPTVIGTDDWGIILQQLAI